MSSIKQEQEPLSPAAQSATSPFSNSKDELPAETPTQTTPATLQPPPSTDRLGMPFPIRLPFTTTLALTTGFLLGAAHGGQTSALRFRAENAHRLPTSQVGWYLYHKTKNYNAMLGGIKEGMRMSARIGGWTVVFFAVEEAVDRLRGAVVKRVYGFRERRREEKARRRIWDDEEDEVHPVDRDMGLERMGGGRSGPVVWVQRDFLSTVVAALGVAGAFSAWNRFPVETAAKTARMSLKVGFAFGVAQDVLSLLRGRKLGYVESVKRNVFGKADRERLVATT